MNAHTPLAKPRSRYPTKAKIARTIEAARAIGLDVVGFEVSPDGIIRVLDRRAMPAQPPKDEFEEWEAQGKL